MVASKQNVKLDGLKIIPVSNDNANVAVGWETTIVSCFFDKDTAGMVARSRLKSHRSTPAEIHHVLLISKDDLIIGAVLLESSIRCKCCISNKYENEVCEIEITKLINEFCSNEQRQIDIKFIETRLV